MKLRRAKLQNVRSFLEPAELLIEGDISIIIGPNGGGKTNLLDAIVTTIRRHLLTSWVGRHAPTPEEPARYQFERNDAFGARLEKNANARNDTQTIEIELEVTERDIENIRLMKESAIRLADYADKKYVGTEIRQAANWNLALLSAGMKFTYVIKDDALQPSSEASTLYLRFLSLFEVDNRLRDEMKLGPLSTPMLSLPVHRSSPGIGASVSLASYNEYDYKKTVDAATSRSAGSLIGLAVGRIAEKYRMLLEEDTGKAREIVLADPHIQSLTNILRALGYDWKLESINPKANQYDIKLSKQGTSFFVDGASSGEKEILTYLFGIYALNVRDALVVVDEPELHLHPKWQHTLLKLFERLAAETGNQFLLATHSPVFVSPSSIQYVSRVFGENQKSRIIRLNNESLPEVKHLFSIVNTYNNESIFFADKIILVEGISDRLFFNAVFQKLGITGDPSPIFEIISVGGKGFFAPYASILKASRVPYVIIADLDYVTDVSPGDLANIFAVDSKKIDEDVIANPASKDGNSLAARLDEAIQTKNVEDLTTLWTYIKRRQRKLRTDLSDPEREKLNNFIVEQRNNSVFILGRGALEDYLPQGFRSKDVDKLIKLLDGNFWEQLPELAREELTTIANGIKASPSVVTL
jgi:predicted ATP-dependent endonuclease of OLD family